MSNNNQEIINRFINGAKIKNTYEAFGVAEIDYSKIALVRFVNTNYMGVLYFGFIEGNGQSIQAINLGVEDDELEVSARSVGGVVYSKIYSGKLLDSDYNFIYDYNRSISSKSKRIKKLYFNDGKVINIYGSATMKELEEICDRKEKINMSKENNNKVTNTEIYKTTIEDKINIIKENKNQILDIFKYSIMVRNFVSTLIDNLDEFVEIIKDNDGFNLLIDIIDTVSNFIDASIIAGKSNCEIKNIIGKIREENNIRIKDYNFISKHPEYLEKVNELFDMVDEIINARRCSNNVNDYFGNIINIFKSEKYSEKIKDGIKELEDYFYVTSLGFQVLKYMEKLTHNKEFVFSILLLVIDMESEERMEFSLECEKEKLNKYSNKEKYNNIEFRKQQLDKNNKRLIDKFNDKNKILAKLFRYRQEIDKLN